MQITVVELYQQSVETILFFVIVPEQLLKITVDWSQIFHRNRNGIPSTFPSLSLQTIFTVYIQDKI